MYKSLQRDLDAMTIKEYFNGNVVNETPLFGFKQFRKEVLLKLKQEKLFINKLRNKLKEDSL